MNLRPPVDQAKAPPGTPPVVMRSMVELAQEANLTGKDLSDFCEVQAKELQRLQLLNIKRNVQALNLDTAELDALLAVLDVRTDKAEIAVAVLQSAANSGMEPAAVSQFALKLARMGIHQIQ
jgi:hypothetical protein